MTSSPNKSTSNILSASSAIDAVIFPLDLTCAKSRTRLNKRFAMRGVPRERFAISNEPEGSISASKRLDERSTIFANSVSL